MLANPLGSYTSNLLIEVLHVIMIIIRYNSIASSNETVYSLSISYADIRIKYHWNSGTAQHKRWVHCWSAIAKSACGF